MSIRHFIHSLLCWMMTLQLWAQERPNIVIMISDDHAMQSIGAYGSKRETTPHLDRLAKEGMLHHRAYTNAALCVPTRFSCLTGLYASRSRHPNYQPSTSQAAMANGTFFLEDTVTIAQELQKVGYLTGSTGKWHNEAHPQKSKTYPWTLLPKNADPKNPNVINALKAQQSHLQKRLQHFGFHYAECLTDGNLDHYPDALNHHNIEYTVRGAIDFLDSTTKEQPFFLWTAFTTTHAPREDIRAADVRMTPEGYTERALGVMPSRDEILSTVKKKGNKMAEMVTWMDAGVGAILNKLDQMGVTENTLVIFLADQQNIGKSTPYECGANIPFIARWPKVIPAQSENHSLLDVTDMAATVIDLAGATPDKELDGMSLRPLWKNQVQQLKPYIFTEMGQTKAVIGQDYKYIAFRYEPKLLKRGYVPPEGGSIAKLAKQGAFKGLRNNSPFGQAKRIGIADPDQLYHLGKDPKEKNNLAHQPEQKEQLERMKRELSHYIQDLGRHFGEFLN